MIHQEELNELTDLRLEHGKVSALDLELLETFRDCLVELRNSYEHEVSLMLELVGEVQARERVRFNAPALR